MAEHAPIDFAALARSLLDRSEFLLSQWLPEGKRVGHEWQARNPVRADQNVGSFSVNLVSGAWADFADGDAKGGDLISLYAYLRGLNNGQAARELMRDLGWEAQRAPSAMSAPAAPPAEAPADDVKDKWQPIAPVPANTPAPLHFRHVHRGEPQRVWEYRFEGELWGYVCRYATSDGGKEILPYTWCVDTSDGRGSRRWQFKQWAAPRPLYVPATLLSGTPADVPVVVVEGEKCALAGHELLGHEFDFVSWPGGGKAWGKASWGWLTGRTVFLWADCDAKRQRLSRAEQAAGVDPRTKPLLPEAKQPGVDAMEGIGRHLVQEHGCTVFWCPIPAAGSVADGWDLADAVAEGWDAARVREFIRSAQTFVVPADEGVMPARAATEGISTPSRAGAGNTDQGLPSWRDELKRTSAGAVKPVRENLVLALDGLPEHEIAGLPEMQGVIAYDEFANEVVKLRATPWGTPEGRWDEVDELELGAYLTLRHSLPSMPRNTLEEGVQMVAKRHRYHPVRDELARLEGTWDETPRLKTWLARCCLMEDEFDWSSPLHQYLARVGTWLVMAICARVLTPGCKFDYMTIFEGPQGWGKSTLARLLGLRWFADTGLVLGDKDSYQNLQSVLVYEWGELDSLNRSEVTKVKQFISSAKDRFRASFDRRARDYPRQVVFIGTTNEDHYLSDTTGNRRMWPVRITRPIDTEWFEQWRDQLFAEALNALAQRQRFHPTRREERELFEPQQAQRQIENAIEAAVRRYLYDEKQHVSVSGENGTLVQEITTADLLSRLGIALDKQSAVVLRQATAALRHCGWVRFRSTRGDRPWMFRRPQEGAGGLATPEAQSGTSTVRAADDCPF